MRNSELGSWQYQKRLDASSRSPIRVFTIRGIDLTPQPQPVQITQFVGYGAAGTPGPSGNSGRGRSDSASGRRQSLRHRLWATPRCVWTVVNCFECLEFWTCPHHFKAKIHEQDEQKTKRILVEFTGILLLICSDNRAIWTCQEK